MNCEGILTSLVQELSPRNAAERHMEKPEGNSSLSQTISTPSSSAACGVTLDIGKEYLLSVSHVNVQDKETIQGGDPLNDVRYTLKHLEVFKAPNGTDFLAPVVLTSSSACGISLGNGSDYLLSGSFDNGLLHTSTCGQIVTDDPNDNFSGGLMEWDDRTNTSLNQHRRIRICEQNVKNASSVLKIEANERKDNEDQHRKEQ
ncbi:hypothetical protein TELCIR_07754 [Teladorsagia circumcincta]|uniref:NTR domain-containing protein n=1 Tax=Teladorsagia circumcincta TaxID=45464 RepID=A0A2G9UJS3_TELCI|nr:hypothetical protein TELCIR_07754 [Teladorsagia circumcincta]